MSYRADSTKEMIHTILDKLQVSPTQLAALLGVSERSLIEWKSLGLGELTPKAKRLSRLYDVLSFVSEKYEKIGKLNYMKILIDGRITLDPTDDEFGFTSLITFITSDPENTAWVANVKEAMESFTVEELLIKGKDRHDVRYASGS
jgi:hypothetical protein